MRELAVLLSPVLWSLKNDIIRFDRSFYKRVFFYSFASVFFIILVTRLLGMGMARLQSLSPEVFSLLLTKGYTLLFIIIFFIQIINGVVIALSSYYHSKELEVILTSPVSRTSLFFSRFIGMHLKASWMLVIFGIPLLVSSGIMLNAGPFYYVYSLLLFFAFSTIPVNIGACVTIFFASIFHAKKLRKLLLSAGIVTCVLLVTLFRIFRPERFVNPELFANLTLFVTELKTPSFVLFPNRWLSESLFAYIGRNFTVDSLIYLSLLFLTSYITAYFLELVFIRYHFKGWGLLQEGVFSIREQRGAPVQKGLTAAKFLDFMTRVVDIRSRVLIKKDLLTQLREPGNIHQALILTSLIIIYLFSISALPVNWEGYSIQLRYMVAFFNLGLILIIIAAICSRLIYPAVVSEAASLWILKSSPLTPLRYVITRFLFFGVPVFVLGELLTLVSSSLIGIERVLVLLQIMTVALVSCSLVSMAVTFGISDMRRTASDAEEGRGRTGSTAHMLLSVFLILVTLAFEIIPVFLYFLKETKGAALTQKAELMIGGVLFLLFLVNLIASGLSMRLSIRKFGAPETG